VLGENPRYPLTAQTDLHPDQRKRRVRRGRLQIVTPGVCALDRLSNAEVHPYPAPTPGDPVEG
jgi:hypothetical protein